MCISIVWIRLLELGTRSLDLLRFSCAKTIPSLALIPMQVLGQITSTRYFPLLYLRIPPEIFVHRENKLMLISRTNLGSINTPVPIDDMKKLKND
jgi:hypothetical protein